MEQAAVQEYLTGNESIAFPFTEDAAGLLQKDGTPVHGASAMLPRDFLLDMVMTIPARHQGRACLSSITRAGSTYTFTFMAGATTVLVGAMSIIPSERSIVAFQSDTGRTTARMVTGPSFISYLAGMANISTDSFQQRLPLDIAAVEFVPFKLLDLVISPQYMSGSIVLYEGYNIQLDSAPSDPAKGIPAMLKITAGSGLGAGRHDPCGDTAPLGYIGTINGQGSPSGSFMFDGDACFRLLPDAPSHRLQIVDDCLPCCTCDDYANSVAVIRNLFATLAAANKKLTDTAAKVNQDITEWNTTKMPGLFGLKAEIYVAVGNSSGLFSDPNPRISSGKSPNYASIVATVRNVGGAAATNVGIAITGLGSLTVVETIYFDSTGQHTGGTTTAWTGLTLPASSYFKPAVMVKAPYPHIVSGTFTITVTVGSTVVATKSVTV